MRTSARRERRKRFVLKSHTVVSQALALYPPQRQSAHTRARNPRGAARLPACVRHDVCVSRRAWQAYTLVGKGDVFAQPRSDPNGLKKVGSFDAKRVSGQWDMRDPAIGRRVTNTALPDSLSRAGL